MILTRFECVLMMLIVVMKEAMVLRMSMTVAICMGDVKDDGDDCE